MIPVAREGSTIYLGIVGMIELDADHWRKRADEARVLATQMHSDESRRMMLEIAANYDKMATMTEKTRQFPKGIASQ